MNFAIQLGIFRSEYFLKMKSLGNIILSYGIFCTKIDNQTPIKNPFCQLAKRLPDAARGIDQCRHIYFDLTLLNPGCPEEREPYTYLELQYVHTTAWNKVTFFKDGKYIPKYQVELIYL